MSIRKTDFFVIGAMKCGTTTICDILNTHSDIEISDPKEPMYFLKNGYCKALNDSEYHKFWSGRTMLRGEGSTMYTGFPEYKNVAQNIYDYNSKAKLVYIVRDPVDRIESHYAYRAARGVNTGLSIAEEIESDERFIQRSQYFMQLSQYDDLFPEEQIKIIQFEEFCRNKSAVITEVFEFLGVEWSNLVDLELWSNKSVGENRLNPRGKKIALKGLHKYCPNWIKSLVKPFFVVKLDSKPKLSQEYRKVLYQKLEDDISKFHKRTGINYSPSEFR